MTQEVLSKSDEKRVNSCEYYQMIKNIMASHESYKNIEVGEVFYIKSKYNYGGKNEYRYVSRNGGGKDKFMAFYKDVDGFIFIKRINATGKLGVEVQCLTTQYPAPRYEVESDPDYVDSIIFEGGYDPLVAEKLITKKKGQARRKNKKLEINFKDVMMAYNHIKTYSVGDIIYDLETTYGTGLTAWKVTNIITRPTDKTPPSWQGRLPGNTDNDQDHNRHGFNECIELEITAINPPSDRRLYKKVETIIFSNFYKVNWSKYYSEKPFTVEDFQ